MTIPGKRRSSSAGKRRRAHKIKLTGKLVKCAKCGKPTMPHRVCPSCGTYQGRTIITPKTKKKKASK